MSLDVVFILVAFFLRARRRRFAGAERGLRVSQGAPNIQYDRVRTPENAPRCRFQTLERRHGFAQIVGSGASGTVERLVRERGRVVNEAAHWRTRRKYSHRAVQHCELV